MKILIITIHDIGNNFGSTLQSCALYEFIKEIGHEVQIINYQPQYNNLKQQIKEFLVRLFFLKEYSKREKSFKLYYNNHSSLTKKKITKFGELLSLAYSADVYITGSDQVWNPNNPCGNDESYYLKFTNSLRKMSYAASLGTLLDEVQVQSLIDKIEDYRYISVREWESKLQLINHGFDNVKYVLDPVFLFPREYYIENAGQSSQKVYGRYLLVYAVKEDKLISMTAKRLARKYNLKIILIGGLKKKCDCDYFIRSAGPREFLDLMNNAQMIVTSSFHAVAFALILNKQFVVVLPKENSMRINSILDVTETINRTISKIEDIDEINFEIDYKYTNSLLEPLIQESKQFLLNSLVVFEDEVSGLK